MRENVDHLFCCFGKSTACVCVDISSDIDRSVIISVILFD